MGVTDYLSFAALGHRQRGGVVAAAVAIFAFGLAAGATWRPGLTPPGATSVATALAAVNGSEQAASTDRIFNLHLAYPADVVRIIDGDTFEARVHVWPGIEIDTKVRLRDIDAPELHARCAEELAKAQAARAALETILSAGAVTISQVGIDKYGGRVDARVATRATGDVSAALLSGGFARSYDGGRRGSWC